MCNFGINPKNFNPNILYVLKRRLTEKNNYASHAHDFITLIYIISGTCVYKINDSKYHVKPDDLIAINAGSKHCRIIPEGAETCELHIGFKNIKIEGLTKNSILPEDRYPVINFEKYNKEFSICCNSIIREQELNEAGGSLILKAMVMKLIVLILKEIYIHEISARKGLLSFESYDRNSIVNTIASFISNNYGNDISLDKISKNIYLSPVYISKVFKEEMGESPINYLIKTRLSKAAEMLKEGHLPVKAIAKIVGYKDAYYFSKLFKKYYGMPPSDYKTRK